MNPHQSPDTWSAQSSPAGHSNSPLSGPGFVPQGVPEHIQVIRSLSSEPRSPNQGMHFVTMMKKNLRMKWRTPVSTVLETILPCLFVVGLILIWAAVDSGNVPETHYVANATTTPVDDFAPALFAAACTTGSAPINGLRTCTLAEINSGAITCFNNSNPSVAIVSSLCVPTNAALGSVFSWTNFKRPRFIPSIDEIILMQWITNQSVTKRQRKNAYGSALGGLLNGGYLHFTPDTPAVRALADYLNTTNTLFRYSHGSFFATGDGAAAYCASKEHAEQNWGVLEVAKMDATGFDVTIHMNRSGVPWTNRATQVGSGIGDFTTAQYLASGFLTLQDAIGRYHATQILNVSAPPRAVHIPMGFAAYDTSTFLTIVGAMAALFLVFGYLYPVSQLVKRIVEEKELRMREAMMIMGLSTAPFYCSWIATYFIFQLVTALICSVLLKVTMLPKSDFGIIFFLFFLFGLSNITLSSVISSFFSKSRIAALASPVLFFIFSVPSFALPDTTPAGMMVLISLLSPTAFANGMRVLMDQEISGGAKRTQLNRSFNGYPMSVVYFMLVLDMVLYLLLTLYLDAVLPSEWGTRANPCFCIIAPFEWCVRKLRGQKPDNGEDRDGRDPNGAYEPDPAHVRPSVELRGLRKEFDLPNGERMVAVRDLSFNMYEGQVFALLGHNGAGKTTAMNLMTGMLELDGGDCRFHGHSVRDEMTRVRQEIGYCPQHNILWNELTCREHLDFFARLKGLDSGIRGAAVEAMLKAVDLEAKGDKFPHELSGGQKRKLSVGIAFVGGSKVVFLDEPTAGMDVAARRHTWELIKLMTPGRTIVLTTHFMDEADLLGNTIAIMAKGHLKCSGSSVFLKSRLGVGYTLTIACAHGTDSNHELVESLKRFVPTLDVLANGGGEVAVRLPMDAVPQFPALLRFLEDNGQSLGIRGHGIGVTTLEEIFLKIGHDEDDAEHVAHAPQHPLQGLPQTGVYAEAALANTSRGSDDKPIVALGQHTSLFLGNDEDQPEPTPAGQFAPLIIKRFHYAKRDTRTIVLQIVLPIICIVFAMLLALVKFPAAPAFAVGDYGQYQGGSDIAFANCPSDWKTYLPKVVQVDAGNFSSAGQMSRYLVDNFKRHEDNRIGTHMCLDSTINATVAGFGGALQPSVVFFTNTSIYQHAGPQALWEFQQTYLRRAKADPSVSVRVATHPLPLSPFEGAFFDSIITTFVAIFVLIPFTFVPSTFVSFIVKEREVRALQLQRASGLNYVVYWCANFVWDMASFMITAFLAVIIFAIFSRDEYIGSGEAVIGIIVLFFFYGLAGVAGAYISSFFFDSHSTAQNIVMLVNFICGFMLVLLAYILNAIESTKSAGSAIRYIFRLVPSYCLGEGILSFANRQLRANFGAVEPVFSFDYIGWPLLYMGLEFPLFMALVFYLDSPLRREQQSKIVSDGGDDRGNEMVEPEDADVALERWEVESGARDATDHVVVKHMRKFYPGNGGVLAVRDLSFGVHRGEVFGFLGTNGAGKTTTISILCGEQLPSRGHGWIAGHDVVAEAGKARKLIGYCPQFDALHDLLTAEEHMDLYAGLHGLTGQKKKDVIERLIDVCGLEEHRQKESRSLSGGNKRKLSVAISLLGAPQVVFLDEPSAGMDPMARRQMWAVIEQVAAHCSVVLTTHHLEEVEALASRMGIMVDGELKCIGPLQHLKTKFGSGFEMSLRVAQEQLVPMAEQFVVQQLPGAVLQERRGTKLTVALPPRTRLSQVFQLIEQHKAGLGVTDYSVSETTLESVFLRISANAKNASDE